MRNHNVAGTSLKDCNGLSLSRRAGIVIANNTRRDGDQHRQAQGVEQVSASGLLCARNCVVESATAFCRTGSGGLVARRTCVGFVSSECTPRFELQRKGGIWRLSTRGLAQGRNRSRLLISDAREVWGTWPVVVRRITFPSRYRDRDAGRRDDWWRV